jgi:outer membrane usher protein
MVFSDSLPGTPLYVSPTVDGIQKDGFVMIVPYKNGFLISPKTLKGIGVTLHDAASGPGGDVYVPATGPESASIDMPNQAVNFKLPNADLLASVTSLSDPASTTPATSAIGAFADYDLHMTPAIGPHHTQSAFSVAGSLLTVLFSPEGFLSDNSLILLPAPAGGGEKMFTRLSTTYEYDQPRVPRVWRLGDVITAPPGWARAEFLGGFQVATDYALQPSRITFPTPVIGQSLAQPSAVALLVNNAKAYQGNFAAGPFSLVGIPIVSGLNEVTVQTRTPSGQVSTQTVHFYSSNTMLAKGLVDYNLSAGYVRHHYGQAHDFYATPAFDGTVNLGITDDLTGTLHSEGSPNVDVLGGGLETSGDWGDLSGAIAISENRRPGRHRRQEGALFSLQYSRDSPVFGVSAGMIDTTPGYNDLGIENGAIYPALNWHLSVSDVLPGNAGSLSFAYTDERLMRHWNSSFYLLSYSVQFFRGWDFTLSAYQGAVNAAGVTQPSDGFNAGISIPIGGNSTAGASLRTGSGQTPEAGESFADTQSGIEGASGEIENNTGNFTERGVRLQDVNPYASAYADVAQYGNSYTADLDVSGSVIAMDGLYFTRPANTAFAVVDFKYPKIPIYVANQPIGRTNASGRLLVPNLIANFPNQISIDPAALPLTASISDDEITVTPPAYGGVIAKFPAAQLNAAYLTIELSSGANPPAGSLLYLAGSTTPLVIGYDGDVYIENPPSHIAATVVMETTTCRVDFNLPASTRYDLRGTPVKCVN